MSRKPNFRWTAAISYLSTRCIPSMKAACFAGAMVRTESPLLRIWPLTPQPGRARRVRFDPVAVAAQPSAGGAKPVLHNACRNAAFGACYCLRVSAATADEFSFVPDLLAAGMTDYVAMITRFAAEGYHRREMDAVLVSSWSTKIA